MNIIINQLQKNFGPKVAVDIENYSIQSGDMLGLVGNNGAGKTTLFRLMLDLLKADGGSVHIGNIDVSRSEEWKNITGAFIDEGFLIDYLTPEEYFYFVGKMYGLTKEEVDKRVARFERFMNGEVIGQKKLIRNYSAGNKQKIGIISAMLHQPQVLENRAEQESACLTPRFWWNCTAALSAHRIMKKPEPPYWYPAII